MQMEGKFSGEGIHSLESDDDLMSRATKALRAPRRYRSLS
jgi:hypothetical protein